jgi:hypothetical protein
VASTPRVIEIFEPNVERQLRALRILLDAPSSPAPRVRSRVTRPSSRAAWSDPIDALDDATPEDFAPAVRPRPTSRSIARKRRKRGAADGTP